MLPGLSPGSLGLQGWLLICFGPRRKGSASPARLVLAMSSRASAPPRVRAVLAEVALGLAAFLGVCAVLAALAGVPSVGPLADKLAWLEAHGDAIDVLFVGSSRVRRGIVPAVFDAEVTRRGGLAIRSFNLGVAGMEPPEADALVRRLARRFAARGSGPGWFLVEVAPWDATIEEANRFKGRAILWHDAPATRTALAGLRSTPPEARFDESTSHLLHWAARATGAGRGPDVLRRLVAPRPAPPVEAVPYAGYEPYTESSHQHHPMRRAFLDRVEAYRGWLEPRLAVAPGVAVDARTAAEPWVAAAWSRQVRTLRAAGIEPVHFVAPTPRPPAEARRLAADGVLPTLFAFDDPAAHPELFAVDRRFDLEHLTHEGAVDFTRQLAAAFAERFAGPTGPIAGI